MLTKDQKDSLKEYLKKHGMILVKEVRTHGEKPVEISVLKAVFDEKERSKFEKGDLKELRALWMSHIVVSKEIIDTERSYLDSLNKFMMVTKNAKYKKYKILQDQRAEVAEIIKLSEAFLSLTKMSDDPTQEKFPSLLEIGAFFKKNNFVKVYSPYTAHYALYENLLGNDKQDPGKSINQDLKNINFHQSGQFLAIQPIQRMPRYKMLLQELINNISPTTNQFKVLTQALSNIEKSNIDINNVLKENQAEINAKKIKKTQAILAQYIEALKTLSLKDSKEKSFWKKEIQNLNKKIKELNNPNIDFKVDFLLKINGTENLIDTIHEGIATHLTTFLQNNFPENEAKDSKAISYSLSTIKYNIKNHFFLTPAVPSPAPVLMRSGPSDPTAHIPGITWLFSKITGIPAKKVRPELAMKKGLQKDLNEMKSLYKAELEKLLKKEKNSQKKKDLKSILNVLPTTFDTLEYLKFYNQLGSYTIHTTNLEKKLLGPGEIHLLSNGNYRVYNPKKLNQPYTGSVTDLTQLPLGVLSKAQIKELQTLLSDLAIIEDPANVHQAQRLNELVLKVLSKREHITIQNEKTFAQALSEFVLNTTTISDKKLKKELKIETNRKFLQIHAPIANQDLIKQLNQCIEKLSYELSKLEDENPLKADKQNRLNSAKKLLNYLIDPEPSTLGRNVNKVRELVGALSLNKNDYLTKASQKVLKLSDPYYELIKKLDTCIIELEKDSIKNAQQLAIAQNTRQSLQSPSTQNAKTGFITENLTVSNIKQAIMMNNAAAPARWFRKDPVESILHEVLQAIALPVNKKKMKI